MGETRWHLAQHRTGKGHGAPALFFSLARSLFFFVSTPPPPSSFLSPPPAASLPSCFHSTTTPPLPARVLPFFFVSRPTPTPTRGRTPAAPTRRGSWWACPGRGWRALVGGRGQASACRRRGCGRAPRALVGGRGRRSSARPRRPSMDQRKAIFRAKLRETKEKQQRRIDPALVRYNEFDQPICRVCNITLKSEALWPAHQVSRKHHEAKAADAAKAVTGAGSRGNSAKQEQPLEPQKQKSSTLPTNFFDNQGTKRKSDDTGSEGRSVRREAAVIQPKTTEASTGKSSVRMDQMLKKGSQSNTSVKGTLPGNFFDYREEDEAQAPAPAPVPKELSTSQNVASSIHTKVKGVPDGFFDHNKTASGMQLNEPSSETAQIKGSLPEGFFDNKDADLRARGIQPQKVDMNDAYKEFEKEIQVDLQEVDDRLEEEEIDAAAEREEYLTLEQQEYRQQVDMLKKQLVESRAARTAKLNSKPIGMDAESSSSDSLSDEEDDNTDFAVDWRAQHLK